MKVKDEYCLSQYSDLGNLVENKNIRLKRRISDGKICVEKHVSGNLFNIYRYLQENPSRYIPKIYECIEHSEEIIIVEEYIEGQTLEEIVHQRDVSEKEAVHIIWELCEGLKTLHHAEPPIICRDLKAENIMLDEEKCVKIVDFNIARSFQKDKKHDTVLMGTAGYAAPEQFGFSQTDNRTDIYALGVLLNYMLTKQFPVNQTAEGKCGPVIQKCIQMDREHRYQNVEELEYDLCVIFNDIQFGKDKKLDKRNKKSVNKYSFVPPGFRERKPSHMISAIAGYLFLIWFCFSLELTSNGIPLPVGKLRLEQSLIFLSQIVMVFVIWNYRGWRERLPLVKSKSLRIRVPGYIIAEFVLIVIAAFISVVLEAVLF
ncbi:MAG TPA: protein kinase [Candidatus Mediterraneibacter norfolkensis]|nr:protein kinase [Candidatus Mediterraneibacter norfolkensis]